MLNRRCTGENLPVSSRASVPTDSKSQRARSRRRYGRANETYQRGRVTTAELAGKRFENPDEVHPFASDMGQIELVDLNGHAVGRGTRRRRSESALTTPRLRGIVAIRNVVAQDSIGRDWVRFGRLWAAGSDCCPKAKSPLRSS